MAQVRDKRLLMLQYRVVIQSLKEFIPAWIKSVAKSNYMNSHAKCSLVVYMTN